MAWGELKTRSKLSQSLHKNPEVGTDNRQRRKLNKWLPGIKFPIEQIKVIMTYLIILIDLVGPPPSSGALVALLLVSNGLLDALK